MNMEMAKILRVATTIAGDQLRKSQKGVSISDVIQDELEAADLSQEHAELVEHLVASFAHFGNAVRVAEAKKQPVLFAVDDK
ncbi:hypothetical protein [Fulvimarina sp. MAC3]|uniref:hypothetical protein n=1 Tax=Fulvimarina sp. MAC3 TaxID=3148887 RepID=UPI0031FD2BFA